MADPLSISASIIDVIQLTGTVLEFINDVMGASEGRRRILEEVLITHSLLYRLVDQVKEVEAQGGDTAWSATLGSLRVPGGPLEQFKLALERLVSKLKPVEGIPKLGKAFSWPFQKEEVNEIL